MPKKMEQAMMREARKKGMKGKKLGAYVYGTMNKMGMMGKQKKATKRGK